MNTTLRRLQDSLVRGFALSTLHGEVVSTLKRPRRVIGVLSGKKLGRYFERSLLQSRVGRSWTPHQSEPGFEKRVYSNYDDYLEHQSDKLQDLDLSDYDLRYRHVLRERLEKLNVSWGGKAVLCLGARLGTEVKSFLDIGCFAIGIDINPGEDNRYVLYGDFHDLQFPSSSTDVVFTNALDHTFDIEREIHEIKRVLKPEGLLIIEATKGRQQGPPGFYESFWWSNIDDLVLFLENVQFKLVKRSPFDYPWDGGEQICFGRVKD